MKNFLLAALNLILCINGKAQGIEFVENKGQWDSRARFGASVHNCNFFLEQSGYKMVLNSAEDMAAIAENFSGHQSKTTQLKEPVSSNKLVLHSHA